MKKIFLITLIFVLVTGCQDKENNNTQNVNNIIDIADNHTALSISQDDDKVDTSILPTIKKDNLIDIYIVKSQDDKKYYTIIKNVKVLQIYDENNNIAEKKPHHIVVEIKDELFEPYLILHDRDDVKILILNANSKVDNTGAIKKDIKDLI